MDSELHVLGKVNCMIIYIYFKVVFSTVCCLPVSLFAHIYYAPVFTGQSRKGWVAVFTPFLHSESLVFVTYLHFYSKRSLRNITRRFQAPKVSVIH